MSVFRLEIDMAFKEEDDMKSFLNLIEKMYDKLSNKQDGELPIFQKVRYHECMHDEGGACGNYTNVEFTGETDHGVAPEVVVPELIKTKIKKEVVAENDALKVEVAELKEPTVIVKE